MLSVFGRSLFIVAKELTFISNPQMPFKFWILNLPVNLFALAESRKYRLLCPTTICLYGIPEYLPFLICLNPNDLYLFISASKLFEII
jgi:hypothetical protein